MKNINNIDKKRRALLQTFATSGISRALINSSPLVAGMLISRHADAQSTGRPDKTVAIFVPGGAIYDLWIPTGSGNNMQLASMSAGYESVKTECNFLRNMTSDAGHGGAQTVLARTWGFESYDVTMGRALRQGKPFEYLNLGVHSNGEGLLTRVGNNNGSNLIPFQDNPFTVFRLLFGDGPTSSDSSTASMLDAHAAAANAIRTKLANYEVHRLNQHLDAISDTRQRLNALNDTTTGSCSAAPDASEFELTFDTFSQQARLQADIIVAALSCGLTSSASLAFGNDQCFFRFPELNYRGEYHGTIHEGNIPNYVEVRAHLGSLTAYLIEGLRNQGILDSTVVIEVTDMGHGNNHTSQDAPMFIAGGGDYVNHATTTAGSGFHQRDLLHTAAKACGVTLSYGQEIPGVLA